MAKEPYIQTLAKFFAPAEAIARELLPYVPESDDGSHDGTHLARVWGNVRAISAEEGGDIDILAAATVLHDCFPVEKDSPLRPEASKFAAEKASKILRIRKWKDTEIGLVAHAIEAHSFSAGVAPRTVEAKVLQDADRLDAIGAIGIARCFYVAGRLKRSLYDLADPKGEQRPMDDTAFALDHFETKLFSLAANFATQTGAEMAKARDQLMQRFVNELFAEIEGKYR
jgi:uncharacterized protein